MSANPQGPGKNQNQLTDVQTLREQARRHIEEGAVTENYPANREEILRLLNEALATELICTLRYRHNYYMAKGPESKSAAEEFLEHANEELQHADQLAERIVQLGGEPDFAPDGLTRRSHAEYDASTDLVAMIRANLVAERVAVETYRQMIQLIGDKDPTTRRLLEAVLEEEEEHADELRDMLDE